MKEQEEKYGVMVSRHCSRYDEPVHLWFNLTYASYLVLPRTALQSMPLDWQRRFVECLEELDALVGEDIPGEGTYQVYLRNSRGRFIEDPLRDYQRGRRRIPLKREAEN